MHHSMPLKPVTAIAATAAFAIATTSTVSAFTPAEADAIMNNELRLRIIGCGVPQVSRIQIGAEERCTLDIPGAKRYLYDAGTRRLIDVTPGSSTPPPPAATTPTPTPTPAPAPVARVANSRYTHILRTEFTGINNCLGVNRNNQAVMAPCNETASGPTRWNITQSNTSGAFLIQTGLPTGEACLAVDGNNVLIVTSCTQGVGQLWQPESLTSTAVRFRLMTRSTNISTGQDLGRAILGTVLGVDPMANANLCLDVDPTDFGGGRKQLQLAPCGNYSSQVWQVSNY